MRPLLELAGVERSFGEGEARVDALRGVSLDVAPGELVLVTGPSGSGKTTLLQIAGALMRPTAGRVSVSGTELADLSERDRARLRGEQIGYVFQTFNLFANLNAEANVALPACFVRHATRSSRVRARRLLQDLGLGDRMRHLPSELSGGEQQRVAIARALINDPALLLADEPTGNLDSQSGFQVIHLLEEIVRDRDKTVLVVTHDFRFAQVADRVVWLEDGKLVPAPGEVLEVTDPVCGMLVRKRAAVERVVGGRTIYFCSEFCLGRFEADPDAYVKPRGTRMERSAR